jgi:hypothetical protein
MEVVMLKIVKSLGKLCDFQGRSIPNSLLLSLLIFISTPAQDNDYWASAPTGKIKLFTISFTNEQNGTAQSAEGDVLVTKDGGKSWTPDKELTYESQKVPSQILWKADVYCSIMKTTDGGNTWFPYEEEMQEHFCGVYLKDKNTGYKVANEFLNKVTSEINNYSQNNKIDSLVDRPHKCTEYYRSADEGWALGWCVRDYKQITKR